jgi:polysaccharide export outer membrane protein
MIAATQISNSKGPCIGVALFGNDFLLKVASTMRLVTIALTTALSAMAAANAEQLSVPAFDSKKAVELKPEMKAAPATDHGSIQSFGAVSSTGSAGAYKIGPRDVLEISVFQVPELSRTLQVTETGSINLPLLGEIPAAGRTAQELERELTAELGAKYLQNPVITVFVKEYNSQSVTLAGAVKKPGVYPIKSQTSLLQIIAMGGGFEEQSDSVVLVMRQSGDERTAARFDVAEIEAGHAEDPILQANDKVIAGTSMIKQTWGRFLRALPVVGTFMLF